MRKIFFGIFIGVVLSLGTAVYASDSIQALLFPAKIVVNGEEKHLDNDYLILNVNSHAYVPIRYVAENTGIHIDYDENTQTIYLARENTFIQDKEHTQVSVGDLILITDKYKETTKVSGHLALNTKDSSYVSAILEFYDSQNNVLGNVDIQDDFQSGLNTFECRGKKDFTAYSRVELKIKEIRPAMKSIVNSLMVAAKEQNEGQIEGIMASIPDENLGYALIDLMKPAQFDYELRKVILSYALKRNLNVNIQDKTTGYTALMYASMNSADLIQPLIDAGADVKIKANDGTTALLLLASQSKLGLVKLYLDKGADPNAVGLNGYTPLLGALRPLFANYTNETVAIVKYLLDAGASVDVQDSLGNTPLSIVKDINNPEIASQLKTMLTDHGAK